MALKTVRHVEYFIKDVDSYEQYNSFLSSHTPEASKVSAPIPDTVEDDNLLPQEPKSVASTIKEAEAEDTDISDEALAELEEITYPQTTIEVPETLLFPAVQLTETIPTPWQEQESHAPSHNTATNIPPLPQSTDAVSTVKTSEGNLPDQSSVTALTSNDQETPVDKPIDKTSDQPSPIRTKPKPPPKPKDLAQKAAKATTTVKPPSSKTITADKQPTPHSHEADIKTEKDVRATRTTPVSQREQSTETRPLAGTNTQGTQTQSTSRSQDSQTTKPVQATFSTQTLNGGITRQAVTDTSKQSSTIGTDIEKTNAPSDTDTPTSSPKPQGHRGSAPVTQTGAASVGSIHYENIAALHPNNETGPSLKTENQASLLQPDQANATKTQPQKRPQVPYKSLAVRLKAALINFFRLGSKSDTALTNSEAPSAKSPSSIASSDASDIADLASFEGEHSDDTVDDVESQPGSVDSTDTSEIDSEYDDDEEWDDEWNDELESHTYENISILKEPGNDGNVETAAPSNPYENTNKLHTYENISQLHTYENIDVLNQTGVGDTTVTTAPPLESASHTDENLHILKEPDTTREVLDHDSNDATPDDFIEDDTTDIASQTASIEQHDLAAPPQETPPVYATIDKSRKQPASIASSDSGFGEASPRDIMDDDISLADESGDDLVDIATKERMLQGWGELKVSWNEYKNLYRALSKGADLKNPNDRLANAQAYAKLASQAKPLNEKLQATLVALHKDINTHFQDTDPEALPAWAQHVKQDADTIINEYRKLETLRNRPKNNPPKVR
ncbi:hypothetical protein [Kistimonas scapharcae]